MFEVLPLVLLILVMFLTPAPILLTLVSISVMISVILFVPCSFVSPGVPCSLSWVMIWVVSALIIGGVLASSWVVGLTLCWVVGLMLRWIVRCEVLILDGVSTWIRVFLVNFLHGSWYGIASEFQLNLIEEKMSVIGGMLLRRRMACDGVGGWRDDRIIHKCCGRKRVIFNSE